jgi:hypothetical protein
MVYGVNTQTGFGYPASYENQGKMSIPVAPSNYIYSQFKYVSGVPAPDGIKGVSVSRLMVLDMLISQLNKIKDVPQPPPLDGMGDEQIDRLIGEYDSRFRQAQADSEVLPYKPAPDSADGALFQIAI